MAWPVGTVVVGRNFVARSRHKNGMEGVIVRGLHYGQGLDPTTGKLNRPDYRYTVEWADGSRGRTLPYHLRKKEPPRGEKSIMDMFTAPAPSNIQSMVMT